MKRHLKTINIIVVGSSLMLALAWLMNKYLDELIYSIVYLICGAILIRCYIGIYDSLGKS